MNMSPAISGRRSRNASTSLSVCAFFAFWIVVLMSLKISASSYLLELARSAGIVVCYAIGANACIDAAKSTLKSAAAEAVPKAFAGVLVLTYVCIVVLLSLGTANGLVALHTIIGAEQ
jgi:hypothetical protein